MIAMMIVSMALVKSWEKDEFSVEEKPKSLFNFMLRKASSNRSDV